jgi:hypothetical protein
MNNPLGRGEQPRMKTNLRAGDRMTITGTSKDGKHSKTIHITRTDRPYVDDFCDAANADCAHPEAQWVVGVNGNMHLEFIQSPKALSDQLKASAERDRQKWLHRQANPQRYV